MCPRNWIALASLWAGLIALPANAEEWLGWYEQNGQQVQFSVHLNNARESYLQGRADELDTLPASRGLPLRAELSGERRGRTWYWTKRYVSVSRDPIQYLGVLSPDGSEIVGWWNIANMAQGRFAMRLR